MDHAHQDGDKLRWVDMCTADCSVIVASSSGHGIHFKTDETQLRTTGRGSVGIRVRHAAIDASRGVLL